jgi:alpha-glucosidase
MLLLTLRGTPTIYYGDELGMRNVSIPPGEVQDPFERRVPGLGLGRDPIRTPMQWSAAPQAGFTSGQPWLPVSSDHEIVNVAAQRQDPKSMLALYTRLIALRQAEPALQTGSLRIPGTKEVFADVLIYFRGDSFLMALNLGGRPQRVQLPRGGTIVLSTHLDRGEEGVGDTLELRPDEGLMLRLTN